MTTAQKSLAIICAVLWSLVIVRQAYLWGVRDEHHHSFAECKASYADGVYDGRRQISSYKAGWDACMEQF